jgi:molybdenum cofactor cytidylyltransferase
MTYNARDGGYRAAGIVLAAGLSKRFGRTKQLLAWGETTLVRHVVGTALAAGLDPVIVVTGHKAESVASALEGQPVRRVFNPDFASGLSSSVRRGVEALPADSSAAVFLLADQPGVTPEVVRVLIQAHRETLSSIVLPMHQGKRGNPVLFDASLFSELMNLGGDTGGRALFEKHEASIFRVAVDEPGVLLDIDTPDDYRHAHVKPLRNRDHRVERKSRRRLADTWRR